MFARALSFPVKMACKDVSFFILCLGGGFCRHYVLRFDLSELFTAGEDVR